MTLEEPSVTIFEGLELHSKTPTGLYGLKINSKTNPKKTLPKYNVLVPWRGIEVWMGVTLKGEAEFLEVKSVDGNPIDIEIIKWESPKAVRYLKEK